MLQNNSLRKQGKIIMMNNLFWCIMREATVGYKKKKCWEKSILTLLNTFKNRYKITHFQPTLESAISTEMSVLIKESLH